MKATFLRQYALCIHRLLGNTLILEKMWVYIFENQCLQHLRHQMHLAFSSIHTIFYNKLNKNSLNIMSLNAESLFAKIDQIRIFIQALNDTHNTQIHVITIQECWLTEDRPLAELQIEGYTPFPQLA